MQSSGRTLLNHLGHYEKVIFTLRRIDHQRVGLPAIRHLVLAPFQLLRHHRGHGGHALDLDLAQHLDPLEDAVQFGCHGFQPALRHGETGQFGDAAHGVLVDGHKVPAVIGVRGVLLPTGGAGGKHKEPERGTGLAILTLEELKIPAGNRLLGLDLGEKTIGLALSDTLLSIATPMQTLKRGKFAADAAQLDVIISAQGVGGLVVGLPLNMDGSDGPSAQSARAFGRNWAARSPLPVLMQDERLSTSAVTRTLLEADASRRRRSEVVDKMAAAYILQGALDRLRNLR